MTPSLKKNDDQVADAPGRSGDDDGLHLSALRAGALMRRRERGHFIAANFDRPGRLHDARSATGDNWLPVATLRVRADNFSGSVAMKSGVSCRLTGKESTRRCSRRGALKSL